MAKQSAHARLLSFPTSHSPAGGWLDRLHFQTKGRNRDLVMDYHELFIVKPPTLFIRDDKPWEHLYGTYRPCRIYFTGAQIINGEKLCTYLNTMPSNHPGRAITSALAWCTPEGQNYYLFTILDSINHTLLLIARRCKVEFLEGKSEAVSLDRDWSPPPASPAWR